MKIGVISYDFLHLKTEQVVLNFVENKNISIIKIFALPFSKRKSRDVLVNHRPNQELSIATEELENLNKVQFIRWNGNDVILDDLNYFVITGAGIVDVNLFNGIPIVNLHPGIIPVQRGLDAFKWSIYDDNDLGNTLHFIDNEVDAGEVIACQRTKVFASDSLETLARRHYENEIAMLSNFLDYIDHGGWVCDEKPQQPRLRMPLEIEKEMVRKFDDWKLKR